MSNESIIDRNYIGWIATLLVAGGFVASAVPKLMGHDLPVGEFAVWGYPGWLRVVVGLLELAGAILLLFPRFAIPASAFLGVVILGALYTHISHQEGVEILRPVAYTILLLLSWLRRPGNPNQENFRPGSSDASH